MAHDLTVAEFREACAYFGGYTKLVEHAEAEWEDQGDNGMIYGS